MHERLTTIQEQQLREYAKATLLGIAHRVIPAGSIPRASYTEIAEHAFGLAHAMMAAEKVALASVPPTPDDLISAVEDYIGCEGIECHQWQGVHNAHDLGMTETPCGECNFCLLSAALKSAQQQRRAYRMREEAAKTTVEPDPNADDLPDF